MGWNKAQPKAVPELPQPLQLQGGDSEATLKRIALALKTENPNLGQNGDMASDPDVLAASFAAYGEDRQLETKQHWSSLLLEILADSSVMLDESDNEGAAQRVVRWLVDKN